jgi:adenine phosphoribosyltransferase
LFRKPDCFKKVIDLFTDHIRSLNVDVVVGLDARGFVLGGPIAYNLDLPFVPVRKKGKLPGKVIQYKYELEYGTVIDFFLYFDILSKYDG